MKKRNRIQSTWIAVAAVALFAGPIYSETIDFNEAGYADGELGGQNGWVSTTGGVFSVSDSAAAGAVNLQFSGYTWERANYNNADMPSGHLSYTVSATFSFNRDAVATTSKHVFALDLNRDGLGTAWEGLRLYFTRSTTDTYKLGIGKSPGGWVAGAAAFSETLLGFGAGDGASDVLKLSLTLERGESTTNWNYVATLENVTSNAVVSSKSDSSLELTQDFYDNDVDFGMSIVLADEANISNLSVASVDFSSVAQAAAGQVIDFTAAEGYSSGNLGGNADWGGSHYPYWQVDPSGSGTVAVDYDANQFRRAFHNTDLPSSNTVYSYSAVFSFDRTDGSISANSSVLGLEFNKASATWSADGLRFNLTRLPAGNGWRLDFASTVAGQFESGTWISEGSMGFGASDSTSDELMLTFQITRGADATDWSYTGTLSNLTASAEIGSLSGSNRVASAAFFTEDLDIGLNNLVGDQASISNMVIDRVMFNSTSGSSGPVLTGYEAWASDYNLTGGDTDDDDGDGLLNVHEYGLGGNPTNALDTGTAPSFSVSSNAVYTHVMLTDPAADISYLVEHTTDLVNGTWTNSGWSLSTNVTGGAFDEVGYSISADDKEQLFVRLLISRP